MLVVEWNMERGRRKSERKVEIDGKKPCVP